MSTFAATTKPRPSAIKAVLVGHPMIAYFALAYTFTWLLDLPMVMGKDGLGIFPYSVPLPAYAVLFILGAFGPTLAAFLVTSALEGRSGVRAFFRRYRQWRFGLRWYLFVLIAFPLVYLASACVFQGLAPVRAVIAGWPAYFTQYLLAVLIFPALITWGEEPGWRGFALTRLQARYNAQRYGPLLATVVTGLLHGLWHLPVFLLVSGPVALGPFNLSAFLINTLGIAIISVTWTWAFNNAGRSILMAVLLHASFNAAQGYLAALVKPYPPYAGQVALAIFFVAALVLVALTKGRLGYSESQNGN